MKISEKKQFSDFIENIFEFFREKGITSCLSKPENFEMIKKIILDAEFTSSSFLFDFNRFSIEFNTDYSEQENYLFMFGENRESVPNEIHIVFNRESSYIDITLNTRRYPMFLRDFLDREGCMKVTYENRGDIRLKIYDADIMTEEDLSEFLNSNSTRMEPGMLIRD